VELCAELPLLIDVLRPFEGVVMGGTGNMDNGAVFLLGKALFHDGP
jgi:hypothetical protein